MFALDEIRRIHDELTNGLPEYVENLNAIGATRYVTYISDGHSVYFGPDAAPAHTGAGA